MPNQIPSPKALLQQQAQFPKTALGATPLAPLAEGITGVLSQVASALPEAPEVALGKLPFGNMGQLKLPFGNPAGLPGNAQLKGMLQSVEAAMPTGLPKISQALPGPAVAAREEVTPAVRPVAVVAGLPAIEVDTGVSRQRTAAGTIVEIR